MHSRQPLTIISFDGGTQSSVMALLRTFTPCGCPLAKTVVLDEVGM